MFWYAPTDYWKAVNEELEDFEVIYFCFRIKAELRTKQAAKS